MRVMIVDDDPSIREVVRLCLELIGGWTVFDADGGADAIDQAVTLVPDLILLDVMMPGIDGVETLRRLSQDQRTRHIPVIFLTAKAQVGDCHLLDEAGATGHVAKPFDPLTLTDDIEAILTAPQI